MACFLCSLLLSLFFFFLGRGGEGACFVVSDLFRSGCRRKQNYYLRLPKRCFPKIDVGCRCNTDGKPPNSLLAERRRKIFRLKSSLSKEHTFSVLT